LVMYNRTKSLGNLPPTLRHFDQQHPSISVVRTSLDARAAPSARLALVLALLRDGMGLRHLSRDLTGLLH
jgi:hypothetical protein